MNPTELLAQILNNNIGNKLTVELASGIVAVFNQAYNELTRKQVEGDSADSRPTKVS